MGGGELTNSDFLSQQRGARGGGGSALLGERGHGALFNDADGDTFDAVYECDDTRPEAYFGADELCNDLDEDCDLEVDEDAAGLRRRRT